MTPPRRIHWTKRGALLFLMVLSIFLFFYRLGARDFETSDEARRALVVQGMIASGDYVIPTLSGETYLKKPPLFYWVGALASRISRSTDEWTYRFPSALAATVTVLAFFLLADRLLPRRAAVLASIMLATCAMFLIRADRAQIDMTLACWVMLAMVSLQRAREALWTGWAPWMFWLSCGLATLTKGPVGLLFPLGAAFTLAGGRGFLAEVRRMRIGRGVTIVLLVLLPWCLAVIDHIGWDEAAGIVLEEAFGGYQGGEARHAEPFYFYLYETPAQFFPWCVFLPAALLALRAPKTNPERAALSFAGAWLLPGLMILSLSAQKRSFYLLPAFGAIALWNAWAVDRFLLSPATPEENRRVRQLARFGLFVLGGLGVAGALAGGAYLRRQEPQIFAAVSLALAAAGLWGLYLLVSLRRGRPDRALAAVVITAILYVMTQRGPMADWFNTNRSTRRLANAVASATPPDADLFTLFRDWHSLEVYLERPIVRENSEKSLRRRLASDRAVYVVMDEKIYAPRSNLFRRVVSRFDRLTGRGETVILASN